MATTSAAERDLLTATQVAGMALVTRQTVGRWVKSGLLPVAVRTPGGRQRFLRSDVERVLSPDRPAERAS